MSLPLASREVVASPFWLLVKDVTACHLLTAAADSQRHSQQKLDRLALMLQGQPCMPHSTRKGRLVDDLFNHHVLFHVLM